MTTHLARFHARAAAHAAALPPDRAFAWLLAQGLFALRSHPGLPEPLRRRLDEETRRNLATSLWLIHRFGIWLGSEDYQLRLSASFLDALSHLRPLIALRTPFAEHYFRQLGEIGILCANIDAMAATVTALAKNLPADLYREWTSRLLAGRRRFEPAVLAEVLRGVVSGRPKTRIGLDGSGKTS